MKKITFLYLVLMSLFLYTCTKPNLNPVDVDKLSIIPKPQEITGGAGSFTISSGTLIASNSEKILATRISYLSNKIQKLSKSGIFLNKGSVRKKNVIELNIDTTLIGIDNEGYILDVNTGKVEIKATSEKGIFYGIQTLLQLFPEFLLTDTVTLAEKIEVPAVHIVDNPRFLYRGMHLDVCRHFFAVETVKKYLDIMAMHKLNTFHWHLTEDQGWRIEIKQYPGLTAIGSVRKETVVRKNFNPYVGDGKEHKGYYTQEHIKEIVAYAENLEITVIPEIEMPGHSVAALAAYPQLSCTGGPFAVETKWGVFEDIYCAGNDSVFVFMQNVLDEVMALFPSEYIHIGGDEAPKTRWNNCEKCKKRMKDEKLNDAHELQSYFVQRIEKYVNSKGKKIIGWDEILEGGLAPNATVMSWRGITGGIEAAKQKHDVIMTPGSHMYFDHYQADESKEPFAICCFTSLEKVYSFEPVPTELSADQTKYIVGVQANLWTEYIDNQQHLEYMLLPRMSALSEVAWTKAELKNWENFNFRMLAMYNRYQFWNYNYRKPDLNVKKSDTLIK